MKKLILLFTIVCAAGVLNGMEEKPEWSSLPKDIHGVIIGKAVEASNNVDEVIAAIQKWSKVYGIDYDKLFSNLKEFTALVDVLENNFPSISRKEIAEKFNTSVAKEYIDVNSKLLQAIEKRKLETVKELVDQEGADPNFTYYATNMSGIGFIGSPLRLAKWGAVLKEQNAKAILQFLLEKGMNPNEVGGGISTTGPDSYMTEEVAELLKQYSRANK